MTWLFAARLARAVCYNARMKRMLIGIFLAVGVVLAVRADYKGAVEAYKHGDYAAALRELRPLAEQGHGDAQYGLGTMYKTGRGVAQDDVQAVSWFRRAADRGSAKGQFGLGNMYRTGRGVPQDDAQAVYWYRKAADQGQVNAQHNLGQMYFNGYGVPRDYAESYFWWSLAAAAGHVRTVEWRKKAARFLTPDQLAAAEARAKNWRPRPSE